jgi:hypothetical protein
MPAVQRHPEGNSFDERGTVSGKPHRFKKALFHVPTSKREFQKVITD